jgi:imidazole glycerol-phosphate synthase subunit HisH
MSSRTAIIDHGVGNTGSVRNILEALGADNEVVDCGPELAGFDRIIIPGVGSFDQIAAYFGVDGRRQAVLDFIASGKPVLGICLGMQILFEASDEGSLPGLAVVPARMRRLSALGPVGKIPHVGFNTWKRLGKGDGAFAAFDAQDFYFVHSFAAPEGEWLQDVDEYCLTTHDGAAFVAAFRKGRLWASQCHPEKSGEIGRAFMVAFLQC